MAKKPIYGECAICGQHTALTYEHVPPKSVFNHSPTKLIKGMEAIKSLADDRRPWEISDLKGTIQQQGRGGYYLCRECNENTGSWYVPFFEEFSKGVLSTLISDPDLLNAPAIHITADRIRPLPVFKQIMVMFCDINRGCFGDKNLRDFLMQKDSQVPFDSKKYRVFCYIAKGPIWRSNPFSVHLLGSKGNPQICLQLSEIAGVPLGFVLYWDMPESYHPKGCDITVFANYRYKDDVPCEMELPVLESNIIFSGDYRTKEEIEKTMEQSKIAMEKLGLHP